jgi:hypothetical protein
MKTKPKTKNKVTSETIEKSFFFLFNDCDHQSREKLINQ